MFATRKTLFSGLLTILCASFLLASCGKGKPEGAGQQGGLPEVVVYVVKTADLNLSTELTGRTSAFAVSEVRPQITGVIQKRLFTEGAEVKLGEPLYQIDAGLYRAAYQSGQAQLQKAEANFATTKMRAERYAELAKISAVSRQENDDAQAAFLQSAADVAIAKAAFETARIHLAYTQVKSPIRGRAGKSEVTEGALVTANQPNFITTVHQLDPIYVDVTQSVSEWQRLQEAFLSGKLQKAGDQQAEVSLILPNGKPYTLKGSLQFSGVHVDQSTGSIQVRAQFPNPNGEVLPGMFVRAQLIEGTRKNAIVVPQQGITRNPKGEAIALFVDEKGEVSQRVVSAERAISDKWLISDGLKEGDKIIVEGHQRIRFIPGAPLPMVKASEKAPLQNSAPNNAQNAAQSTPQNAPAAINASAVEIAKTASGTAAAKAP